MAIARQIKERTNDLVIYEAVQKAFRSQKAWDWEFAGRMYMKAGNYELAEICFWWARRLRGRAGDKGERKMIIKFTIPAIPPAMAEKIAEVVTKMIEDLLGFDPIYEIEQIPQEAFDVDQS